MKRSRHIQLVLLGTLTAGGGTGCGPSGDEPPQLSTQLAYPNNHRLPSVGYYHAPFHRWYDRPYNQRDPQSGLFFAGGQWNSQPHESIINISKPDPDAVRNAEAVQQAYGVHRGGFGHSSGWRSGYS